MLFLLIGAVTIASTCWSNARFTAVRIYSTEACPPTGLGLPSQIPFGIFFKSNTLIESGVKDASCGDDIGIMDRPDASFKDTSFKNAASPITSGQEES